MAERSAAALHWVVVTLFLWVFTRLIPPTGTRRKTRAPRRADATSKQSGVPAESVLRMAAARRSPYSTDRAPLDGSASRLSRPYLPALVDSVPEVEAFAVAAVDLGIEAELSTVGAR
ncbi:hypothetical protein [Streptomyces sp. NBC_01538]|uniref:hypothetical protein n=1 Tax=Streptomyces sp. NBC_01538 TaxID=2903897 RepID=UPI00386B01DB